jgi:hypothetical protein
MAATLQRRPPTALTSSIPPGKTVNAETVTIIATAFLKRIGNKGNLKPKRVSMEEGIFSVEVEMKKLSAVVRIDSETHEIKEYEIQPKGEEAPFLSISPKALLLMFGISSIVFVMFYFMFKTFGF